MRVAKETAHRSSRWCVILSFLLHALLLAAFLLSPAPEPNSVSPDRSITVEIITQAPAPLQPDTSVLSANSPPTPPAPPRATYSPNDSKASTPPTESSNTPPQKALVNDNEKTFVKPSHMLSQEVLADHRSRQARDALKQLAPADQIEQLCNLEAMAQVGTWSKSLKPDRVVAYAMADLEFSSTDFIAKGAAIHSEQHWYRLQFKCQLTPDNEKVVAFEFLMGDAIPRDMWAEHNLPDEDGASD